MAKMLSATWEKRGVQIKLTSPTLARSVKPASVRWEHLAASKILKNNVGIFTLEKNPLCQH